MGFLGVGGSKDSAQMAMPGTSWANNRAAFAEDEKVDLAEQ